MPVTIKPEPLFLKLNKEVADHLTEDIFSQPYTIDYDGSNSLKIEFGHSGPLTFYDGDGRGLIEGPINIKGPGNFVFKVKVDNDVVNRAQLGSHPFQASIKTTEEIPKVEKLTYYETEILPSNERSQISRISFATEELHVMPEVILREVVLDDSGVVLKKEIWPVGGFKVEPAYKQDDGQVDVTTTRDGDRLRLIFRNRYGPELDAVYIVTPTDSRYVDANGRPVEIEIYLNSSQEIGVGTADDPNNLRGNVMSGGGTTTTDGVFSTHTDEGYSGGDPKV